MAAQYGCPLLGGDTVRTEGETVIGVTALGAVPAGRMVRRTAAAAGDRILVSGTIGDAALGLGLRRKPPAAWSHGLGYAARAHLVDRYLHPQPRLALAAAVRTHARAAMDVSDGLAGDLAKMMRGADLGAEVAVAAVPLSPAAREALALDPRLIDTVLTGGDDYEILCTAAPDSVADLAAAAAAAGVPLSVIGTVAGEPARRCSAIPTARPGPSPGRRSATSEAGRPPPLSCCGAKPTRRLHRCR